MWFVPVPPGLAHRVRGSAIISEVCCLPWKTLQDGVFKNIWNHYRAHHVFRYGWFHAIRALQPSPLIKNKNIRLNPKLVKFDPRPPQQRNRDEGRFKTLSKSLQNCLPSCSFFLFHDIKSNCSEVPTLQETEEQQETAAFTDSYDIATNRFKSMIDEHVCSLTITQEEIRETDRLTRGQAKNYRYGLKKGKLYWQPQILEMLPKQKWSLQINWRQYSTVTLQLKLCSMELKANKKLSIYSKGNEKGWYCSKCGGTWIATV